MSSLPARDAIPPSASNRFETADATSSRSKASRRLLATTTSSMVWTSWCSVASEWPSWGPNGIGKSTLLKIVMGELDADEGEAEWGYETHPGYFAQDHREQFYPPHNTAEGWVWDSCPERDIGYVRARMALMLFSGDDSKKRLSALSGGEAGRLVFTRLAIARPNVLVLDEPTNHLDLESIEALVEGLKAFPGTLVLVSHDRWFVSRLATRIVEIKPDEVRDYHGTYENYVHFCGDDHLDADRVILKAKTEKRKKKGEENDKRSEKGSNRGSARKTQLLKRQEELTGFYRRGRSSSGRNR